MPTILNFYLSDEAWVRGFSRGFEGLTCDFAEEIRERKVKAKRKAKTKAKAIDQSFRLRLYSGLRQSGTQSSRHDAAR